MSLLTLVVAYAGIVGGGKVDTQVRGLIEAETEVADADVTRAEKKALVAHGDEAAEIVQRLDVSGVIAGQLKKGKKGTTLTIVVYGHDGAMLDLVDLPVGPGTKKAKKVKKLSKDDLDTVKETIVADVQQLVQADQERQEEQRRRAREVAAAEAQRDADAAAAADAEAATIAAKTSGPARKKSPMLRVHAGIGARGRTFVPEPTEIRGYRSTPVPAARVAVEVSPIRYASVGGEVERTLTMNSDIDGTVAPSSIFHWQGTAALRLPLGTIELAALGGVGGRDFVIDGDAPTPDGHYLYAMLGGRFGIRIGQRIEVRAFGAFEPVIGGADDAMSTLGPSSRSALEVGGGVLVAATDHVYVAGEANYQRFTWSWDAGSATDEYPSGTLSIGASY